jgi:hypothetical protein
MVVFIISCCILSRLVPNIAFILLPIVPGGWPLSLLPLLVLIETVSYLACNVSLGLKLAANFTNHMLIYGYKYNIRCINIIILFIIPILLNVSIISGLYYYILLVITFVFIMGFPMVLYKPEVNNISNDILHLLFYWLADLSNYIIENSLLYNTSVTSLCLFFFIAGLSMMWINILLYKEPITWKRIVELLTYFKHNAFSCIVKLLVFVLLIKVICALLGISLIPSNYVICFIFFFSTIVLVISGINLCFLLNTGDLRFWYKNAGLSIWLFIATAFGSGFYYNIFLYYQPLISEYIIHCYENALNSTIFYYVYMFTHIIFDSNRVECSAPGAWGKYFGGSTGALPDLSQNPATLGPGSTNANPDLSQNPTTSGTGFAQIDDLIDKLTTNRDSINKASISCINMLIEQNTEKMRESFEESYKTHK